MKNFILLSYVLFCAIAVCAQDLKDTARPPIFRYSVSLQVGQYTTFDGTEPFDENYINEMQGHQQKFAMGTGLSFRYYTDETFFLHARVMYDTRRYISSDSIVNPSYDVNSGVVDEHHSPSYAYNNWYQASNLLIGLGGGHEGRYNRFLVRAGGELDFIKVLQCESKDYENSYDDMTQDTIANGATYHQLQLRGFESHTWNPLVWGIGITGHATLEYLVKPSFGIGATLYMGGFFVFSGNAKFKSETTSTNHITNSNGVSSTDDYTTVTERDYSTKEFVFSPLNGQVNFVYYFRH